MNTKKKIRNNLSSKVSASTSTYIKLLCIILFIIGTCAFFIFFNSHERMKEAGAAYLFLLLTTVFLFFFEKRTRQAGAIMAIIVSLLMGYFVFFATALSTIYRFDSVAFIIQFLITLLLICVVPGFMLGAILCAICTLGDDKEWKKKE